MYMRLTRYCVASCRVEKECPVQREGVRVGWGAQFCMSERARGCGQAFLLSEHGCVSGNDDLSFMCLVVIVAGHRHYTIRLYKGYIKVVPAFAFSRHTCSSDACTTIVGEQS